MLVEILHLANFNGRIVIAIELFDCGFIGSAAINGDGCFQFQRGRTKSTLVVWCAVFDRVPCSGAKRRGKALDEVSTAILGDAVAENIALQRRPAFWASG